MPALDLIANAEFERNPQLGAVAVWHDRRRSCYYRIGAAEAEALRNSGATLFESTARPGSIEKPV